MSDKVSFVCTTFRRFTCVKRIVYQYYAQTHKNKELIIFNTDVDHPIKLGFDDPSIIVINNNTDYLTGKPYENRGQICRDAVTHASGDYFMLADDDDIYLPWHLQQAVEGIQEIGKDAWKPIKSFFATQNKLELAMNTMEASVIVKMDRIREIGFETTRTGYEGITWYMKLRDEKQLDENNTNCIPSYCFNWSDPAHIAGHKQSGSINDPNNFENHKEQSRDISNAPLQKENFDGIYKPYYDYMIKNPEIINQEYFNRYAKQHIEINCIDDFVLTEKIIIKDKNILEEIKKYKPDSIHDIIPSPFFTKYDSYDYVWSKNCFEWNYAIAKYLQPKTFLELGVRFGFSFLPTLLGSEKLEYALGWDLETYGNNQIANSNIKEYYNGNCRWEIQHIDSQKVEELPQFFDLINIDACHDYDCKIHDLKLAMRNCRWVIIDDYDYHSDVRRAVDYFTDNFSKNIKQQFYIPTFRGTKMIEFITNK